MDLQVVLVLLVVSSLLACHNGVEGGTGLSEKEYLELEKQLELLNKPAVKTIHSDHGDIIDCVDFYKQPAFDHPLLKNHTFLYQVKPNSLPRRKRDQVESKSTKPINIGLRGEGCPVGTVPIRRITIADLIRERLTSKTKSLQDFGPGTHYAVLRTTSSSTKFGGAGAYMSLHNPYSGPGQYTAARVKLQNGVDSIEVGWRVDQSLYGDRNTRLFINFNDEANGNWWLLLGNNLTEVGFWPKAIFTGLGDLANYVDWGGEAFSPPGTYIPAMGRGTFPKEDPWLDAFFTRVSVIDEYGKTVNVDNAEEFADNPDLYRVQDLGYKGDYYGRAFVYGGPGGIA